MSPLTPYSYAEVRQEQRVRLSRNALTRRMYRNLLRGVDDRYPRSVSEVRLWALYSSSCMHSRHKQALDTLASLGYLLPIRNNVGGVHITRYLRTKKGRELLLDLETDAQL